MSLLNIEDFKVSTLAPGTWKSIEGDTVSLEIDQLINLLELPGLLADCCGLTLFNLRTQEGPERE